MKKGKKCHTWKYSLIIPTATIFSCSLKALDRIWNSVSLTENFECILVFSFSVFLLFGYLFAYFVLTSWILFVFFFYISEIDENVFVWSILKDCEHSLRSCILLAYIYFCNSSGILQNYRNYKWHCSVKEAVSLISALIWRGNFDKSADFDKWADFKNKTLKIKQVD